MAKRGRPRKNGVKQGWVLARGLLALYDYGRSRMADEKYSEALKAGVAQVRQRFPDVSPTEVKRWHEGVVSGRKDLEQRHGTGALPV